MDFHMLLEVKLDELLQGPLGDLWIGMGHTDLDDVAQFRDLNNQSSIEHSSRRSEVGDSLQLGPREYLLRPDGLRNLPAKVHAPNDLTL